MEDKKISITFVPMDSYACGLYRVKNIADVLFGTYNIFKSNFVMIKFVLFI